MGRLSKYFAQSLLYKRIDKHEFFSTLDPTLYHLFIKECTSFIS